MRRLLAVMIMAPTCVGAFSLDWPVDCTLAENCHIQQFMDRNPGPGHADFTCGPLSYDTHKGTDIALPNLAAMHRGVTVRASAAGVVKGLRDGMADVSIRDPSAPDIKGRECGNGLVIDHGNGWETQYCHMARGSLRHRPGDKVVAGEALGRVGLSGNTEFPHLHLSLRKDGKDIDPFDPDGASGCGAGTLPALWSDPVAYQAGGLVAIGLSTSVPEWEEVKQGLPAPSLDGDTPALVVWVQYFGNRAGDALRLSITAPNGQTIIAEELRLDRAQAQGFRAIGRKHRGQGWDSGPYRIEAVLIRDGAPIDRRSDTVPLP